MATVLARPATVPAPSVPVPPGRDTFVDAVRALGTICVVALHWLMAEATWDGHSLVVGNALHHGAAWLLTWPMQVLPLLFFASGAAAAYQHARPEGRWRTALGARIRAVARPVAVLAVVWVLLAVALVVAGVPGDSVRRLALMAPQPLWFLLVWLALLAPVPLLLRAWRRWRWRALAVAVVAPLVVDLLRFGAGLRPLAWANVLLVWAVPFLAGLGYADDRAAGRACRLRPAALGAGLAAGVAGMVVLVAVGPYPASMVGMPGDAISNLNPPTAPIVAQSLAQVCAVLLLRTTIVRWAHGPGRELVGWLSRRSMTVYVWHLTAMFAVVGLDLVALHERLPAAWGVDWWASRPAWFGAYGLVLAGLVRAFGRFEGRRSPVSEGAAMMGATKW